MRKKILGLFLTVIMLSGIQTVTAQVISEICDWPYTPNTGTNNIPATGSDAYVLFTWETIANGNVEISIQPHPDNAGGPFDYAAFRGTGTGMAAAGFKVDGASVDTYFSIAMSIDRKKVILTPKQTIANGASITFNGQCEYKTNNDDPTPGNNGNDFWPTFAFPTAYSYGTNCSGEYAQKLATPTGLSIVNNVLTFNEVTNATEYVVRVFWDGNLLKSLTVLGSGETIAFPLSGEFLVTLTASDNTATYANSDESSPVNWALTNPDGAAGTSAFCEVERAGNLLSANFSLETNEEGEITITINEYNGQPASYRGGGVDMSGFTIAGIAGSVILERVGSGTNNPNIFRAKENISIPKGALIDYNGLIEWVIGGGDGYGWNIRFDNYVYGSACTAPQLNPPTNLTLGVGNTLTFTPDANAATTTVYVMFEDNVLLTIPNFISGNVINFPVNGAFTICARSISGSIDYLHSNLSTGIPFTVALPDGNVDTSEYCEWEFNPSGAGAYADDSDAAYLSWTTEKNGDMILSIAGTVANKETTAFRAPGLFLADMTIGGLPAVNLLTIIYGDEELIFSPVSGISIPKGTVIAYNGMLTYRVLPLGTPDTELDNLWPQATLNYTYGSACGRVAINWIEENDPVVARQYYSLQGFEISQPIQGNVYLIKQIHESGKTKVIKVLNK